MKPVQGRLYQYKDIDTDTVKFYYYFPVAENNDNWIFLTNKKFECVYGVEMVEYRDPIDDYDTPLALYVLSDCAVLKSDKNDENYFIFYKGQLKNVSKNILLYYDIIPCRLTAFEVKPKKIFKDLEGKLIDVFNES
jgi:hypothetical protein